MKKTTLVTLAVIVLVMLLGAMGCIPRTPAPPATTPEVTPAPPRKELLVLRVGSTRPFKTTNRFADYWYGVLSGMTTHDSLIKLGADTKPVPWLASSWEVSADSQTFTFSIVGNATWHDGTPLTPEDVKFSIEYYRDRIPGAGWMKEVIQSVTVDGNKVILALTKPYGNLLTELMAYPVIPKHIWAGIAEPLKYEGENRIIASGPFKLVSWDTAAGKFVFAANADYFQGKPNVDRLEVNVFRTMDALVMALIRGEIDTWWDYSGEFPYVYIPPLLKSGDIEFASATFVGVPAALGFNLKRQPVSDIAFRQAITYAINYKDIVNLAYFGYGTVPTYGFVPPTYPNFDAGIPQLEFNAKKAKELLDNIGITDTDGDGLRESPKGKNISLSLLTRSDIPTLLRVTEMVAANLKAIGIGTTIRAVDSMTWVAIKDAKDYDLVFFRATPWGNLMHAGCGSGYFDSRRTGHGVLHNLDASEYLQLCDARLATALPNKQEELDKQLQQLHAKYLPGIALVWIDSVYPYRKGWDNWVIDHITGGVVNPFSWFKVTKAQ